MQHHIDCLICSLKIGVMSQKLPTESVSERTLPLPIESLTGRFLVVSLQAVSGILPVALGFAAGCMIYIVFAELIPDALEETDHSHVAMAATASAAW